MTVKFGWGESVINGRDSLVSTVLYLPFGELLHSSTLEAELAL